MISASIVLYKTNKKDLTTVVNCSLNSSISTLYIIDNSPTNELEKCINNYNNNRIIYIFNGQNIGYGSGHNIAIRNVIKKDIKYHIILNPDIIFSSDSIDMLCRHMDLNPEVGQVMPKVVYPNGDIQYLCKLIPTPIDLIFKRFLPPKLSRKQLYKFRLEFTGYNQIMNIPYLSGCFMFFRISSLKHIGLFDERFFMYPEDIDITRRMHEKYKTIFYPDAVIIHAHTAASYTSKKMLCIHIFNMIKYFNKWGWIFDKKRKLTNKQVLTELNYKE